MSPSRTPLRAHSLLDADVATGVDRRVLRLVAPHPASAHHFAAADGTRIAYKRFGSGPTTLVFCNGLGGTYRTFAEVFAPLLSACTVLVADYRGLFESGPPAHPDAIDVATHADDVAAMLAHAERPGPAVVFGWSMGVQVALELFRRHRGSVSALVLASGVEGRMLESVEALPAAGRLAPAAVRALRERGSRLSQLLAGFAQTPLAIRLATELGLVGRNAAQTMEHAALLFSTDPRRYWRMAEELQRHDAADVLPRIDVPTLLLHGEGDVLAPVAKGRALRERIPGSEIWVFAGCRHAVILEYPERVTRRLADFLERRLGVSAT